MQAPLKHRLYRSAAGSGERKAGGWSGALAAAAAVQPVQARQACSWRQQSWLPTSYWRRQPDGRGSGTSSLGGLGQRKGVLDGFRVAVEV